jgi:hypothetical protein
MQHSTTPEEGAGSRPENGKVAHKSNSDMSSEPVEWRDIATNAAEPGKEASSATRPTIVEGTNVSDRIQSRSGPSLTIDTNMLTVTLVGIPKISIADLVYRHHLKKISNPSASRFCAMFIVENTSNAPILWRSQRTRFIGCDGYTYDQSHISLDSRSLAPGCHTTQVKIEPNCRARVVTPVEKLPQGIDVTKVVHTVPANQDENSQRLIFTL